MNLKLQIRRPETEGKFFFLEREIHEIPYRLS
jgi:hypothetical protein